MKNHASHIRREQQWKNYRLYIMLGAGVLLLVLVVIIVLK